MPCLLHNLFLGASAALLVSQINGFGLAWSSSQRRAVSALSPSTTHSRSSPSTFGVSWRVSSLPRTSSHLAVSTTEDVSSSPSAAAELATSSSSTNLPRLGDDGVYHIENKEQYKALMEANPDKILVLKVFAPWCRACKGLEPKFLALVHSEKYQNLPLLWANLSIQHNKEFVKSIGVLALPTIQFYVGRVLTDTFPCGPSKVPILKRKLAQLVNENVDAKTRLLKESSLIQGQEEEETTPGTVTPKITVTTVVEEEEKAEPSKTTTVPSAPAYPGTATTMTEAEKENIVSTVPFFQELSLADLDEVLSKAKKLNFEPGSILLREGKPGRIFYILIKGEVEVYQRTMVQTDPLISTPGNFLGSVINVLHPGEYFGERAMMTGEPRVASVRATEPVTCWAFDKDDFPASSVLSGRTKNTEPLETVNDKYGVSLTDLYEQEVAYQIRESSTANQVRGSVNSPEVIRGVDTEEDLIIEEPMTLEEEEPTTPRRPEAQAAVTDNDAILSLLTRFQMIRHVNQCFQYIVQTGARWDDAGIRNRRALLVKRLSPAQRTDFKETFKLIDVSGDGEISLSELKNSLASIGETKSDDELSEMMPTSRVNGADDQSIDGDVSSEEQILTEQDFMGIMAEAEFYHLFRDIFASLDPADTGFVKARELDRVLCGVRDLISDDRKSIIDVEDDEMLIDYEQFSRMLLGSALV